MSEAQTNPPAPGRRASVPRRVWLLIKGTVLSFINSRAPMLAAALAFYTMLSLTPIIAITVVVVGVVLGDEAARGEISDQFSEMLGPQAAKQVELAINQANNSGTGLVTTLISVALLIFGATAAFNMLQVALDTVWNTADLRATGVWGVLKSRLVALLLVLLVGAGILASVISTGVVHALVAYLPTEEDGLPAWLNLVEWLQIGVSFALLAGVFSLLFRMLPAKRPKWRDVWVGGVFTALMFTLGKDLIVNYVGKSGGSSAYGAAGSLAAVLLWMYYSSLVFLIGASFAHEWARQFGTLRQDAVGGTACLPGDEDQPDESDSSKASSSSSSSSTSTATTS
ncbi:MAG: YihY/virulence factor BrkB family protein [Phycisphaerales bacterium]